MDRAIAHALSFWYGMWIIACLCIHFIIFYYFIILFTCHTVVDCGQPESPNNGDVDLADSTTFGDVARYSCDDDYKLQGNEQRQCQSSGQWSGSVPICIKYDCGDLPSISNGNKDISGTTVGSRATFSCNSGYRLEGSQTRICQASARWSGTQASCVGELKTCHVLV